MANHTEGPWQTVIDTNLNVVVRTVRNDKNICLVDEDEFITEEGRADALLIAAAPDLLKVAQSVVYVAEHSGSNAAFVLRGLVDDARAAIAKATA